MAKVIKEYERRTSQKQTPEEPTVSSVYVEDYEFQYGQVNYKNKVVLDVGADIGSTAFFFLEKGAELVVAVEGSAKCFRRLKVNAKVSPKVVPVQCFIDNPAQIEDLILRWKPDIVKMDIEGSEIHLFQAVDRVFGSVQEYLIEVHNNDLLKMLKEKCAVNSFEVINIRPQSPSDAMPPYIVYVRKINDILIIA